MVDQTDLEARVRLLEQVVLGMSEGIRGLNLTVTMALTALSTVIDDQRPDDPTEADRWFDRLLEVALANVRLRSDHTVAQIIRNHGPDAEMLAAEKADRAEVADRLADYFLALKQPQGGVE